MKKIWLIMMMGMVFVACKKSSSSNEQKTEQKTQSSNQDSTRQAESTEIVLSGSFYAVKTRELLIMDWKDGNVFKVMYAPGGSNAFER